MALTEPTRVHRTAVNAPQPPTAATVRLPMAPLAQPPQVWWPRIQPTVPGARSVRPVRIGDTERSAACDLLTLHYSEGRLAEDEFEQRLEAAVAARYSSELRQLFDDLPRQRSRRTTCSPLPPRAPRRRSRQGCWR